MTDLLNSINEGRIKDLENRIAALQGQPAPHPEYTEEFTKKLAEKESYQYGPWRCY